MPLHGLERRRLHFRILNGEQLTSAKAYQLSSAQPFAFQNYGQPDSN